MTKASPRARHTRGERAIVTLTVLGTFMIWEIAGRGLNLSYLPPFSSVLYASWELTRTGQILTNLSASLWSLLKGFVCAAGIGVALGALMGRYRVVDHLFDLYVDILLVSPTLIYVPVLFAMFGVSRTSQTALVFLYAFPVIAANTRAGVRGVDTRWLEMAQSFGASERAIVTRILLPGAAPLTLTGLRIGMGRAVKGMINGEMYIALVGLGALIKTYGGRFEPDKVLGILLVVIAVALVFTALVQFAERRVTRWLL